MGNHDALGLLRTARWRALIVSKHVMKRYATDRNPPGVRVLVMEDTATPFRPDAVQAVVNRLNREEE